MSLLLAGNLSSCQIVIGVLQMAQGFPKTTCDFTKMTKRSLAEKEKKVIVLSTSTAQAQSEQPSLDIDVIAEVSRRLKNENINVIADNKVADWIDDHGGVTEKTDLTEIGRKFRADFIVLFSFDDFGYREENSPGLYRGHAACKVVVVEMVGSKASVGTKSAKLVYSKPFNSKFPNQPISAEREGPDVFRQRYIGHLSQELVRLFVDYRPEDEI
ncbi:MAG TPA: hypothetical protein VKU82_14550 [Planctomycetaceae bacterium]|nr:hypothetical protein [Planctomycetaceae bacterium]